MDLKKEAIKMDLAKIASDLQTMNNKAKIHANKQKEDLALMASSQAKIDADAAQKEQAIEKKMSGLQKKEALFDLFWI